MSPEREEVALGTTQGPEDTRPAGEGEKTLENLIRELPPELRGEVEEFVLFLLEKRRQRAQRKLRQDWAGALRDYRDQYTSLELQAKALEWRGD